jgi:hypothetical protein
MNQQEFEQSLQVLAKKYETTMEEVKEAVGEAKKEFEERNYFGVPVDQIPLENVFVKVAGILSRRYSTTGREYIVCVLGDSGPFESYPAEVSQIARDYRDNIQKGVEDGKLAGPTHPQVQDPHHMAKVGDPINERGEVVPRRKQRRMDILAFPADGDITQVQRYSASLFDRNVDRFKPVFFTWIKVRGNVSQTNQEWFNFSDPTYEIYSSQNLTPAYEYVLQNNILPRTSLREISMWWQSVEKRSFPVPGGEYVYSGSPVLVIANAVQIQTENPITDRQGRQYYRIRLEDSLDPECREFIRMKVPVDFPLEFAEDSRVFAYGQISMNSEEFGGGWSMKPIDRGAAIFPIPGESYPLLKVGEPTIGATADVSGSVSVSPPQGQTVAPQEASRESTAPEPQPTPPVQPPVSPPPVQAPPIQPQKNPVAPPRSGGRGEQVQKRQPSRW